MPRNFPKTDSSESLIKHLYVLILAGGGGTRLWPLSLENSPKQFLRLFEEKSLFQLTLARARKLAPPERIFISTSAKYAATVRRLARIPAENIITEPRRRDTALAHGLGALYIYRRDPEAVIINLASDHLVSPVSTFVKDMHLAAKMAAVHHQFVTVGIKPKFAHPGMGHIRAVKPLAPTDQVLQGERFVEKPPLPLAKRYTTSGKYFWNANLYVWPAKLFLDLLETHAPKTSALFPKILSAIGTDQENQLLRQAFQMAPTISIDYAVSEKLTHFLCVVGSFSWTDVGDWSEVWENLPKDALGNVIAGPAGRGEYIGINSQNNLLFLDKQLVATVGITDTVIVDTPDVILICKIDDDQAVKQVVQILKDKKLTNYL